MALIPELLAPAGNFDCLVAAVENGADAVYLGACSLGARAYADNFDLDMIARAIDYCHLRGVCVFVTLNTLVLDSEMDELIRILCFLETEGADGVIIQDQAVACLVRELGLKIPVHASTQMSIHNVESVHFLEELGVKRVILARELSLDQIRHIKANTGAQIEVFAHGALCISYSGQCLLSSMIGGRSGNRGHCAQPCRKGYKLLKDDTAIKVQGNYLLSPRDLNTSRILPELIRTGVDSLKIEGRMKRPEYVAGVVRVYRTLLDRYAKDPDSYYVKKEEYDILEQLFNRGFTTSYLEDRPRRGLMSPQMPYNRGVPVGEVTGYDKKSRTLKVRLTGHLNQGDGIGLEGDEDRGQVINRMSVKGKPVEKAGPGQLIEIPTKYPVKKGQLFRTRDSSLMDALQKSYARNPPLKKIPIDLTVRAHKGKPLEIKMEDMDGNIARIVAEGVVEEALKRPMTSGQIEAQVCKLGNTVFSPSCVDVDVQGNVFIPIRQLNEIRGLAVDKLSQLRINKWKRSPPVKSLRIRVEENPPPSSSTAPLLSVVLDDLDKLKKAIATGADIIYMGGEVFRGHVPVELEEAVHLCREAGVRFCLRTPVIIPDAKLPAIKKQLISARAMGVDELLVSNPAILYLVGDMGFDIVTDISLNVFNGNSLAFYRSQGASRVCLSPELTLGQIRTLALQGPVECMVQGRYEVMVSRYCLIGDIEGGDGVCSRPCEEGVYALRDNKGYEFPLEMDSDCRMHILNSRQLCMLDHIEELLDLQVLRIEGRWMDADELEKVTALYRECIDKKQKGTCRDITAEHTTGHYYRGVL